MPRVKKEELARRAGEISARLGKMYPQAKCSLDYKTPLQLLVATILSAQCTDVRVNKVTPALFRRYKSAADFAAADLAELEKAIQSTGFFRNKAKNIKACCRVLVEKHRGQPPRTMEELVALPGVARKTANVVLGNAYDLPGLAVDTHVGRLSRRLGLSRYDNPIKVEQDLTSLLPEKEWAIFSHRLIFHGRQVCAARKPLCSRCVVADLCPKIGVVHSG